MQEIVEYRADYDTLLRCNIAFVGGNAGEGGDKTAFSGRGWPRMRYRQ
jgi:hypothetical protein